MLRAAFVLTTLAASAATIVPVLADEPPSLTAEQVRAMLRAGHGHANFAGKRMFALDLGDLDFRNANFDRCNLFETSFHGSNLTGASFVGAYLSATKFPHAIVRGARLTGATLLSTAEEADFTGANFSRTTGYLVAPRGTLVNANFANAKLSPEMSNQPMGLLHTIFADANLRGANLSGADLSFADLSGANFSGANLRGAKLRQANLGRANFTDAILDGADVSGADIGETIFTRVRGRATLRGLDSTQNRDQAIFG
jgi:hypothetical protein